MQAGQVLTARAAGDLVEAEAVAEAEREVAVVEMDDVKVKLAE